MRGRVLIVDDDPSFLDLMQAGLRRREFDVSVAADPQSAAAMLRGARFDALVSDLNLRGASGLDVCRNAIDSEPGLPVIVITAFGSLDSAVAAIRAGAYDFVTKPVDTDELALILDRAVQLRSLRDEVKRLRDTLADPTGSGELLGASEPMLRVRDLISRVADSETSILITGETGAGKEVAARTLHAGSRRKSGPFVAVNCAALPETLLESELFGHVRGAFTDARQARRGLFAEADGGTIFLDEIGLMPLALQPRLLRAIQERRIRPLGAEREEPVNVRIVAATNRDLDTAVERGEFREDLYFRINVVQVHLPPLRDRGGDVLLLAQEFLRRFAARAGKQVVGISEAAARRLLDYDWPGNVRELQNCMERAVALTRHDHVTPDDLPDRVREHRSSHMVVTGENTSELPTLEEVERRYIERVLAATRGNRTLAARILGMDRKTLYRKLDKSASDAKP